MLPCDDLRVRPSIQHLQPPIVVSTGLRGKRFRLSYRGEDKWRTAVLMSVLGSALGPSYTLRRQLPTGLYSRLLFHKGHILDRSDEPTEITRPMHIDAQTSWWVDIKGGRFIISPNGPRLTHRHGLPGRWHCGFKSCWRHWRSCQLCNLLCWGPRCAIHATSVYFVTANMAGDVRTVSKLG